MEPIHLHHVWEYTDVDRRFWEEHLADWLPKKVIDAHTHVNEPKFQTETMTDTKRRQYWVNEVSEPISAVDAAKCYATVFPDRDFSCLAFGNPTLDFDIEASNASLEMSCAEYGWHRLAVIGPDWSIEKVERELDQPKTLGVKVYYALIPGQDPESRDKFIEASIFDIVPPVQLDLLNRRGSILMLHVPKAGRLAHPENIAEIKKLRQRWPEIRVIIAHLGRSYTLPHAKQALAQLADDEGLWFDNSAVLNPEVHRYALETLGPQRILYGTDNPIFYMRGRRRWEGERYINHTSYPFYFNTNREPPEIEAGYTLYMYEALRAIRTAAEQIGLSRDDIESIFHGNAKRLHPSLG